MAEASPYKKVASSPWFSFVQKLLVADDRLNLRGWNVQSLKALGRFGRGLFLSPVCLG
jgi:hypothetical protein